jgi:hypothetical protein
MTSTGWSQVARLHVCVAGDGRHEDVAVRRLGRMPKVTSAELKAFIARSKATRCFRGRESVMCGRRNRVGLEAQDLHFLLSNIARDCS